MTFLAHFSILAPYLLATLISSLVAIVLLRGHKTVPGRVYFGVLMFSVAVWSFFNFLEDAADEFSAKLVYSNIEYLFIAIIPVLFLRFATRLTPLRSGILESTWFRIALWIVPSCLAVAVWFDPTWGGIRRNLGLAGSGEFTILAKTYTPWFWVFTAYSYGLMAGAMVLWFRHLRLHRGLHNLWSTLAFLGALIPWAANALVICGWNPWPGHDLTTPAFSAMGLLVLVSMDENRVFTVLPAAREAVMETWPVPVLVFDQGGALAYLNTFAIQVWPTAQDQIGSDRGALVPALAWLPVASPQVSPGSLVRNTVVDPGTGIVWDVEERPLMVRNRFKGSLLTCHDVSSFEKRVSERTVALEEAYVRLSDELQHRRRTEEQLFYYSLHDSLTGLANRSLFLSRVGQALERVKRTTTETFGVLILNFADFKKINDRLGHAMGDEFLVQTALRLGKATRTVDTASRSSADTFLLLLEGVNSVALLQEAAERVRTAVEAPLSLQGTDVIPAVRIGLLLGTHDHANPEQVLADAEIALTQATRIPSSPLVLFNPEWRRIRQDQSLLKDDLEKALVGGDLHLVYQPIVNLSSGELKGYEALTRWTHPVRGPIPPNLFIPLAEREGTIRPLGLWVLRETSRLFVQLGLENPAASQAFVAVNVSPVQLSEPDFVSILLGMLDREGLDPKRLHIEITETALVENFDRIMPMLSALRQEGISIKLDDFGTGYSSLQSLYKLPVSSLKIDRSFVIELPRSRPIIRTIARLADELGLDVVAEGIETPAQRTLLGELGCANGQGYLFSKGWTKEELVQLYAGAPGPHFTLSPETVP